MAAALAWLRRDPRRARARPGRIEARLLRFRLRHQDPRCARIPRRPARGFHLAFRAGIARAAARRRGRRAPARGRHRIHRRQGCRGLRQERTADPGRATVHGVYALQERLAETRQRCRSGAAPRARTARGHLAPPPMQARRRPSMISSRASTPMLRRATTRRPSSTTLSSASAPWPATGMPVHETKFREG